MKRLNLSKIVLFIFVFVVFSSYSCREKPRQQLQDKGNLIISIPIYTTTFRDTSIQDPLSSLSKVTFVFFNGNEPGSSIVEKREEFVQDSQKKDFLLQVSPKEYYLLVIGNATPVMEDRLKIGNSFKNVNEYLKRVEISSYQDPQTMQCLMLNAQGLVHIDKSNFQDTNQNDSSKKISVEIIPCLARFIVHDYPVFAPELVNLAPKKYAIEGGNRENYISPLRKMAKLSTGIMEQLGDNSAMKDRYAITPSYIAVEKMKKEGKSDNEVTLKLYENTDQALRDRHGYAPPFEEWFDASLSLQEKYNNQHSYQIELTSPEGNISTYVVPFISIIYRIAPKGLDLNPNEGYAVYKGKYIHESQLKQMIADAEANREIRVPTGIDPSIVESIKVILKRGPLATGLKVGFNIEGIDYYFQGENYYPIHIRHFNDDVAPNIDSYGRYGIVRNNEYHLKITKIQKLGFPSPLAYMKAEKKVTENKRIDLSVNVLPIVIHDVQEIEF